MLYGKTAFICDECVSLCYQMLYEEEEAPLSRRKKKAESHQPQVLLKPAEIKAVLDEYVDVYKRQVTVDGEMLDEPYVSSQISDYDEDRMLSFPVEVPEDSYFVMGDNRGNSLDSRYREVGIIRENQIFGKVVLRIYPFQAMGTDF